METGTLLVSVAMIAAACGQSSVPAPKPPAVVPVATATATAKNAPPTLPPPIPDTGPAACRFTASKYDGLLELQLGPEGNSFAYAKLLSDVEVKLSTKSILKDDQSVEIPLRIARKSLSPLAPEEPVIETLQCTSEVPVVAQIFSQRWTIGAVLPKWDFHVAEHQADGWSRLMMPEALLWEGAQLFVRSADIEGCAKQSKR